MEGSKRENWNTFKDNTVALDSIDVVKMINLGFYYIVRKNCTPKGTIIVYV